MPPKDSANWTAHPEELTNALQFLHSQKSRAGQGGNFDKTVFSEAAVYMATECPPKTGGPKTAASLAEKWKASKKLHENILKVKQKTYPGASGWTYTDELGFNVTDDTQDAWRNFVKAHLHFRNFATPAGGFTFRQGPGTSLQSLDDDDDDDAPPSDSLTLSSDLSQPLTDWSQSNFDGSQMSDPSDPGSSLQIAIPAPARKRAPAEDVEAPWSSKRSRTTGPELILALGRSVDGIGKVIENVFAPKKPSAMSPSKKVEAARKLALEDMHGGYIAVLDRTCLNILFGRDTSAADAYISDEDPFLRAQTAQELLNPTQNYQYN
ncbi:hypothetical protein DFH07DRAFT_962937 [Mycena maculata]|uniref:Myb/SANT-like domain-containing protein n=1 Tax=Mycena maculata TaxID=230809 RepID=A0AAD7IPD3_9AGAR|nr:hypothetical protein DFH07DRAFT_962937 [Mycena maculata]